MKNRLRRLMTGIMLACIMAVVTPIGQMTAWAANTRIAFSDPSVMVGNEVTVNMKITSDSVLGKADIMLAYDPAILEFVSGTDANGGAGAIKVSAAADAADQKEMAFTLKFKALQAGSTQISVSSQEIYDGDSQLVTVEKQGTSAVKVTSPASTSKDASLSSLKISPGVLTPEFSADVENYTTEVNGSTGNLVVNAVAANAGATVTLEGAENLQVGENQVVVRVTAEDRETVKTYTITATKLEGETEAVTTEPDAAAEPSDEKVTLESGSLTIEIIPLDDGAVVPDGYTERQIEVGDKTVTGWVDSTEAEPHTSCLFYGMNENGEKHFYRYDLEETTIQKFFASGVSNAEYVKLVKLYEDIRKDYNLQFYMLVGVGVLALILLVIIIILLRRGKNGTDPEERRFMEDRDYDRAGSRGWDDSHEGAERPERTERRGRRHDRRSLDDELKEAIYLEDVPDQSDDFEEEASLEDMEQQLRDRLAREAAQTENTARQRRPEPTKPQPDPDDDDDFEIMDLDD